MSHVSFRNSNRATRFNTQAKEINKLQDGLNSELTQARKSGDFDRVRDIKSELKQLDTMEDKIENALETGKYADIAYLTGRKGEEAFFKDVRSLDNIADEVGELLHDLEFGELNDSPSSSSSSTSSSMPVSGENADGEEYSLDGPYLLELQRNDPEAFRAALDKVPDGLKQEAYLNIQNEIQSENRFWSMMTSLQQANHDTAKQIIGNFRV